jgi:hypothetical protein
MAYLFNVNIDMQDEDERFIEKLNTILTIGNGVEIFENLIEYCLEEIPNKKIWIHGLLVDGNILHFQYNKSKSLKLPKYTVSFEYEDNTFTNLVTYVDNGNDKDNHGKVCAIRDEIHLKNFSVVCNTTPAQSFIILPAKANHTTIAIGAEYV